MPKALTSGGARLAFIDWTRGLAAIIMLQGHAFHSFTKAELRDSGAYVASQFLGGLPPAMFLFLVGVTLAFRLDSRERAGRSAGSRVWAALRRAGYLFGIAFLFRLQLWLFGWPNSPWTDLFRVDILNAMGLAAAVLAVLGVFPTADRVRLAAAAGVAIAAVSPLVSQLSWRGGPPLVKSYLAPDPLAFSFFPWAAFVAFGMSAGSIIRVLRPEHLERATEWAALLGLGLIVSGQHFASVPYSVYPKSEFWLDSPWQIFIKLGTILLILAFAYLWARQPAAQKWSWVRQFGTTSLLVYWVHIELIYGRWLWFWKENLTVPQTTVVAAALIVLMLLISLAKTEWAAQRRWNLRPRLSLIWTRKAAQPE
jgi:uncharacterized membrane protein